MSDEGQAQGGAEPQAAAPTGGAPAAQTVATEIREGLATGELTEADLDRYVTVTVDGEQRRIRARDALRDYTLRSASHKRMEEAARLRKETEAREAQARELLETIRDPAGLLAVAQHLGVNPKQLRELIEAEERTPEDVKRERALAAREKALAEREAAEKRAREEAAASAAEKRERAKYIESISKGLESAGLPKSQRMMSEVAKVLAAAFDAGDRSFTVEDAVQVVREEMTTHSRALLGELPPEQLRALLGDKLDAVRQQDIEKAKAHRNATRPKPNGGRPAAAAPPKKRIHSSQLTPEQYSRLLNGEDIDV